jgi:hypothetical protein
MNRLLSGGPPAPLDSYNTELPPEIHQVVNETLYNSFTGRAQCFLDTNRTGQEIQKFFEDHNSV